MNTKLSDFGLVLTVILIVSTFGYQTAINLNYLSSAYNIKYHINPPFPSDRIVCITFDDGWKTQYTEAVPILQKYGFNATFFVVTRYLGFPAYMNWSQVENLNKKGNDIESHTVGHLNLNMLSLSHLTSELVDSKQKLLEHGISSEILAYPFGKGYDNQTVRTVVSQNYLIARSIVQSPTVLYDTDRYALPAYDVGRETTTELHFEEVLAQANYTNVIILTYHQIVTPENYVGAETQITVSNFEWQMAYLKNNGFKVETMKQLFLKEAN